MTQGSPAPAQDPRPALGPPVTVSTLDEELVKFLDAQPAILAQVCPSDTTGNDCIQRFRYTHRPLTEQLGLLDIRQFELDVFADPAPGSLYQNPFLIRKSISFQPETFTTCITIFRARRKE